MTRAKPRRYRPRSFEENDQKLKQRLWRPAPRYQKFVNSWSAGLWGTEWSTRDSEEE